MIHSGGKKRAVETVSEAVHMLHLANKDFKDAIMNVLKELKKAMYKELRKDSSYGEYQ